jgi:hypothetical protein
MQETGSESGFDDLHARDINSMLPFLALNRSAARSADADPEKAISNQVMCV